MFQQVWRAHSAQRLGYGMEYQGIRIRYPAGAVSGPISYAMRTGGYREMKLTTNPRSSAQVKNAWSCAFTPPYDFMAVCFNEAQGPLPKTE